MKTYANTFYRFGTGKCDIEFTGTWTGWIMIDSRENNIEAVKREIKHFILNGPDSKKYRAPEFLMYLECILDDAEIEFEMLSRDVQEQILDEMLFENRYHGTITEYAEIVESDDYDEYNY